MAIQRRAHGAATAWTTSQPIPYSASATAGDCCYLVAQNAAAIGAAPAGWTEIASDGPAAGYYEKVFRKDATYSGTPTQPTITATGGSGGVAWIEHWYSDTAGMTLDAAGAVAMDTAITSTAFSATGASITTSNNDMLVGFLALKATSTMTAGPTSIVLTQASATLGTQVGDFGARLTGSSPTNSLHYGCYHRPITTGASGAPSMTATAGTGGGNTGGLVALIRLREVTAATDYTPSQNDAEGITDSAAIAADNARTQGDPVGVTDSASGATDFTRPPSDPVGIADSAVDALDAVRAPSDPVGTTDSAARVVDAARGQADPVGLTDAVSASFQLAAAINDAVGIADTDGAQTLDVTDVTTDPVGLGDVAAAQQDASRSPADPVALSDTASGATGFARAPSDPVGLVDQVVAVLDRVVTVADLLSLIDGTTVDLTGAGNASLNDLAGITDSSTVRQDDVRAPTDPAGVTDAVTIARGWAPAPSDLAGISDSVTCTLTLERTITEMVAELDGVETSTILAGTPVPHPTLTLTTSSLQPVLAANANGLVLTLPTPRLELD